MKTVTFAAILLVGATVLAGCATPDPALRAPAAFESVSIDNCGFEVTVDVPPERIVTVKSTSTELLLALGLGDRIIGTAFPDGAVPEEWATEGEEIPVISDFQPSEEAVLDLEPDFIFAGWESNLTPDAAGDRAGLKALGIGTYVSPAACKESGYRPEKLSFDNVFDYMAEAGTLFGASAAATELVAEQRSQLDAIEPDDRGFTALWWSSGTDTPYVGAGIGAPQMILQSIGLENIAGDIEDSWSPFNWEAVIDANPDVIVLVDATWNTAESKRAYLASNPATAGLAAVRNENYLVIPFAAGEAGVRNVEAASTLSEALAGIG